MARDIVLSVSFTLTDPKLRTGGGQPLLCIDGLPGPTHAELRPDEARRLARLLLAAADDCETYCKGWPAGAAGKTWPACYRSTPPDDGAPRCGVAS